MKVICLGDSNTYGYDPRSWFGGRYDPDSRWVDILAAKTGWTVCNWGENGQAIPLVPPVLPPAPARLFRMLGSNDLLQGSSPEKAAERLERLLTSLPLDREQILLIAPPPFALGEWIPRQGLIQASRRFALCCRDLAGRLGIPFADAGAWQVSMAYDGAHFTEQGHRAFAAGLLEVIL